MTVSNHIRLINFSNGNYLLAFLLLFISAGLALAGIAEALRIYWMSDSRIRGSHRCSLIHFSPYLRDKTVAFEFGFKPNSGANKQRAYRGVVRAQI